MKKIKIILLFSVISLMSCKQYQVVQEIRVNMYHMHHPKRGVEIILTKDTLEIGKWYKLNRLNTIEIPVNKYKQ